VGEDRQCGVYGHRLMFAVAVGATRGVLCGVFPLRCCAGHQYIIGVPRVGVLLWWTECVCKVTC
jgi:hypothetical protein